MICENCEEDTVITVADKVDDKFCIKGSNIDYDGYVPDIPWLGGGDYINIKICYSCGILPEFTELSKEEMRNKLSTK